ncbi:hypothetical protein BB050_00377 [Flavobacterium anhuiense]|uniref:Uncharacterized protein n=1 Tax=Flavobacterium anhuiense TaxID=459526 RepID=A0AAC9GGS8_9FLAO|nr:hypothetical protein [Flavobacterium anhuiense]AOC93533.1 hypothetical protein BB050_00377 [Flavobacterium anhuiense]
MNEKILENQLSKGSTGLYENSFDIETYSYTNNDLDYSILFLDKILKKNSFSKIDEQNFNDRIYKIFGRLIDPASSKSTLCINFEEKCSKTMNFYRNDNSIDIKPYLIYIIKKHNFITELYAIPEIIDYQKEFPYLIDFENNIPSEIRTKENDKVTITKWKDISDLSQKRQKNIQTLINRNKYLFNDNKASLVWLKFNDEYFLESLVKVFGYVQDKDLLKWVLDRNLNDDEFDKLLFTKTCNNRYILHKEIFEVMTKADNKSKENYLLYLRGKTELPKVEDANFRDKAKIYALYCYYATKFTQSIDQGYVYTFFPKLNDEKFEEEFKRSNYYNIPDFKKLFDDTKNGSIGLPM